MPTIWFARLVRITDHGNNGEMSVMAISKIQIQTSMDPRLWLGARVILALGSTSKVCVIPPIFNLSISQTCLVMVPHGIRFWVNEKWKKLSRIYHVVAPSLGIAGPMKYVCLWIEPIFLWVVFHDIRYNNVITVLCFHVYCNNTVLEQRHIA
jgi:hypothetical protein